MANLEEIPWKAITRIRPATARQVALAFLTQWHPVFTIPKASSPAHAAENAANLSAHHVG